ncbi:MAG: hypothetical protein V3R16_03170 [Nitrospirales bacterium]
MLTTSTRAIWGDESNIGELVTVGVLEDLSRQDSVYLRGRK